MKKIEPVPILLPILLAFLVALPGLAGAVEDSEEQLAYNEVKGEVTNVGKRALSVEFSRTKNSSSEMLLPIGEATKLIRLKSLDELKAGDTVQVRYTQTYREDEKGKRIVLKTTATEIALLRSAPRQELTSREETELE